MTHEPADYTDKELEIALNSPHVTAEKKLVLEFERIRREHAKANQ